MLISIGLFEILILIERLAVFTEVLRTVKLSVLISGLRTRRFVGRLCGRIVRNKVYFLNVTRKRICRRCRKFYVFNLIYGLCRFYGLSLYFGFLLGSNYFLFNLFYYGRFYLLFLFDFSFGRGRSNGRNLLNGR